MDKFGFGDFGMYTWKNRCYDSFLFPEGIPGLIELKYEGLCLTTISSFAQHKWEKDGLIFIGI